MSTRQNKTALVTGASRGIGRATAATLARAVAHALVHYGRSAQEAGFLVSEIQTKASIVVGSALSCPSAVRLRRDQRRDRYAGQAFCLPVRVRGIRVNAVAPGVIDTDVSRFVKTEAEREQVLPMQALKRIGQPIDVADVITFLASDRARWVSGQTIHADGGSKL